MRRTDSKAADTTQQAGPTKTYPPLKEVRKSFNVTWYRCAMKKGQLGVFMERSDLQGLFQALGHLAIWGATGTLVYNMWAASMWMGMAAAMVLHGTVGSTMVYGCHELGHKTVFRTKWLNEFFLTIFSLLFWWDPIDYAMSHTHHHRYSQYPDGDRENVFPLEPSLDPWVLLQMFTCNVTLAPSKVFGKGGMLTTIGLTVKSALGGVAAPSGTDNEEWLLAVHADQPKEAAKAMQWCQKLVLFHALVFFTSVYTGQWAFVFIVNLHIFFGNWYSFFVGSCQHCGLQGSVPDFRKNTRSITLDPFSEFLFWRMNWHIEHHMFANVPCYNLKALHSAVADDMPKPRSLIGAWREMRSTWHRQQKEPGYEYDTPLPKTAGLGGDTKVVEAIGASIGGLAPKALE